VPITALPVRWKSIRAAALAFTMVATVCLGVQLFQSCGLPARPIAFEIVDSSRLPQLCAVNGMLETTLVAAPLRIHIGGVEFAGAAYNGVYGGPVLRLRPGDRLRLHLVNRMPTAINLHFHGLRVSPAGTGDNMHVEVQPGTSYTYDFRIPPHHPPGLFWYHDHAFGDAETHVTAGLSGALLIDGFAAQFGGLAQVPQALLVLKDWADPACGGAMLQTALHCRIVSINGEAAWAGHMQPGGRALWRISNQGANLILHLKAPGLELIPIGQDGLPSTGAGITNSIDILPASRTDVLVRATRAGQFDIIASGVPTGTGAGFTILRVLGGVTVSGPPAPLPAPLTMPHLTDLRHVPVQAQRTIVFAQNQNATVYTVDGKTFDPARTDLRAAIGGVEEWTIRNTTTDFHEFHIHQLGFQLAEINHTPQSFTGFIDDVRVPENGEVKLLIPFTNPEIAGHIMFHCHVLKHEDLGMMATLELYQPGIFHICRFPGP
jgi:suppressor of ftsI